MSFGIEKCAHVGLHRGKVYKSEGVTLPSGDAIRSLSCGEMYKYLGILENSVIDHISLREKLVSEYKRRVRRILSSELSSFNKFQAINSFALPVIRYTAGILHWPVNDLKALDRQTRKLLTLYRGFHPRSDVDHLYVSRKLGGRGLKSVEDVVAEERCSLYEYIQASTDTLISEVKEAEILLESQSPEQFRSDRSSECFEHYLDKPLHGYYERACNNVWDAGMSSYWLAKGDLSIESEGFLTAAREQALSTNAVIH